MTPEERYFALQAQFTQDDAFELFGCGASGNERLVWRRFMRRMPETMKRIAAMRGYEVKE